MKKTKIVPLVLSIWLIFFVSSISLFAQNNESDFIVTLTSDNTGVVITGYIGSRTDVIIPNTIQGLPVKEIGFEAFIDPLIGFTSVDRKLTRIVIPEGVTKIGAQAFRACKSLVSVILPSTLIEIEDSAFADLPLLSNIELPLGLKIIGRNVFSRCGSLSSINLPVGLEKIGPSTFEGSGLSSFPNPWPIAITTIAEELFENTILNNVDIPEGITIIGSSAFSNCRNLTNVTLPSTISYIGINAFSNCVSLTIINIPESVQRIRFDYMAFGYNSNINLASQARLRQLGYDF